MEHKGRIGGEFLVSKASDKHRWAYFPGLRNDEAILIKLWDSAGRQPDSEEDAATREPVVRSHGLHTAFEDPSAAEDAEDRESIEVRTIAFLPNIRGECRT